MCEEIKTGTENTGFELDYPSWRRRGSTGNRMNQSMADKIQLVQETVNGSVCLEGSNG